MPTLAAQEFITDSANYTLDREQKAFLKSSTFFGNELVANTFKMALMNLYLHNIGDIYGNVPVTLGDALLTDPGYRVDYVLTNPPFGKKSAITMTNEKGEEEEEDLVYNRINSSILFSISTGIFYISRICRVRLRASPSFKRSSRDDSDT